MKLLVLLGLAFCFACFSAHAAALVPIPETLFKQVTNKADTNRKEKGKAERQAPKRAAKKTPRQHKAAPRPRQPTVQQKINAAKLAIKHKIERRWLRPAKLRTGLSCTLEVRMSPSGEVLNARVVQGSGNAAFDRSAEQAVWSASPLPVPAEPELFKNFRVLRIKFKPE